MRIDTETGLPELPANQRFKVVRRDHVTHYSYGYGTEVRQCFKVLWQERFLGLWWTLGKEWVRTGPAGRFPDETLTPEGIRYAAEAILTVDRGRREAIEAQVARWARESELLGAYPPKRLEKGELVK